MSTTGWQPSQLQRERDAYRRGRARRSAFIAALSSAVFVGAVVLVVGSSSGWPLMRSSFFDFSLGLKDVPGLLGAFWINVQIMLITEVVVLVLAALIAFIRTLQGPVFVPLRVLAAIYTDIFRGFPVLIVLYLVGFGLPSLQINGVPDSTMVLCIIALSLTYTAYVAEVFRAGIDSVHPSQRAAARSIGLSHLQTMRHVVFPQAVRRVMPALLNDFVSLQKDTSLVSVLGVIDVVLKARNNAYQDFKFVHYIMAGIFFLLLTIPLTRWTDWVARRRGWVGFGGIV